MSKLNLNTIVSWVYSHIIEYPRAMYICYYSILLVLLVFYSPICGLLWLLFPTGYFLYHKNYKDIFVIWGVFLFIWYFIFTACMFTFEEKLLIKADLLDFDPRLFFDPKLVASLKRFGMADLFFGPSNTCDESYRLIRYIIDKYTLSSLFEPSFWDACLGDFCLQTVFILSMFSSILGIDIYIPSLLHGLVYLFKFIFGGSSTAKRSPGKESEEYSYPSPNPTSVSESIKSFFGKGKPPTVSKFDIWGKLSKELNTGLFNFYDSKSKVVKGKKMVCCQFGFFWNKKSLSFSLKASADELKEANIIRDFYSKKK